MGWQLHLMASTGLQLHLLQLQLHLAHRDFFDGA